MHNKTLTTLLIAAATIGLAGISQAQTPAPATPAPAAAPAATPAAPLFATIKVEGTDNVYVFRYQNHQAMFVVTPAGVIATDPISYGRPQAAKTYVEEIRKITKAPIRYLIYSHHHYDHIAGGKPFKDAGAVFVAHKNTKTILEDRKNPEVVVPDFVVDDEGGKIELGGTTLELLYLGKNHGDNSLIMRLPKEKIIFVVDFVPLSKLMGESMTALRTWAKGRARPATTPAVERSTRRIAA